MGEPSRIRATTAKSAVRGEGLGMRKVALDILGHVTLQHPGYLFLVHPSARRRPALAWVALSSRMWVITMHHRAELAWR
jgi:hypothetical protein